MAFLVSAILMVAVVVVWTAVCRVRRRRAAADDVIYLGYDDQDNVGSMRAAMLDRLHRGEIRDPD
jgi:hypothetical protein